MARRIGSGTPKKPAATMLFIPDQSLPRLPSIPDTVPLCDFMFDEQYGRHPVATSLDSYTCGLSGSSISAQEQKSRVEALARSLAQEFGWSVNQGSEFDKVVGIFALNTVSFIIIQNSRFPKMTRVLTLILQNRWT